MVLLFVLSLSGFVCFILCLVVSVVAESLEKAERVAECIGVEYVLLELVLSIDNALRDNSLRIHLDPRE